MERINVTKSSMPEFEEYVDEIREIWESHKLTNMGPRHEKLRGELKNYLNVENIDLLTNGHMALELTMQAMELKGEVITTPFTFASTTHALVRSGLEPVFCDINENNYTLDVSKIEPLINEKTCAILPVHVYGNLCDVDAIGRLAKKHGLKVIYDAAHAFGETFRGEGVGSFGDASCFSFHATKVFHTVEGGAVCYADLEFGRKLGRLKNFGIKNQEIVDMVGANAKMNEFCAAMGICNLRHIEDDIAKRKKVAERYEQHLRGVKGIRLNPTDNDLKSNYAYFPVLFDPEVFAKSRDVVFSELAGHNIYSRKYFYPLTNAFDCYKGRFDPSLTPVALRVSNQVLTLPIYPDLPLDTVDMICEIILG